VLDRQSPLRDESELCVIVPSSFGVLPYGCEALGSTLFGGVEQILADRERHWQYLCQGLASSDCRCCCCCWGAITRKWPSFWKTPPTLASRLVWKRTCLNLVPTTPVRVHEATGTTEAKEASTPAVPVLPEPSDTLVIGSKLSKNFCTAAALAHFWFLLLTTRMMVPFSFPRLPWNQKTAVTLFLSLWRLYHREEQPTIQYIRPIRFGLVRKREYLVRLTLSFK